MWYVQPRAMFWSWRGNTFSLLVLTYSHKKAGMTLKEGATLKTFCHHWKQKSDGARQHCIIRLPYQFQMRWCLYPRQYSPMQVQLQTSVPGSRMISSVMVLSEDHQEGLITSVFSFPTALIWQGSTAIFSETALVSLQGQVLQRQSIDQRLYSVTLMSETVFPIFLIFFFLISSAYFKHFILFPSAFLK